MLDFIKVILKWLSSFSNNSLSKISIYAILFIDVKLQSKVYLKVFKTGKKFHFLVLILK